MGYLDGTKFANKIMIDSVREEGDKHLCYKMAKKEKVESDIYNEITDHVMLVQLIDTDGNINHDSSIIRCWIYYSNDKIKLPLIKEYLDIICSPYKYEKGMYSEFKDVYYYFRYVNPKTK